MKSSTIWKVITVVILLSFASDACLAQNSSKPKSKAELRREKKARDEARQLFVIDSITKIHRFTFVAERAITSMSDQPYITLNTRADIVVTSELVESRLPFYGSLHSATIGGGANSPLDFKSTEFTYQDAPLTNKKNGKVFILIKATPTSGANQYTLGFEIFDNGSAALSISMREGSGQTFYGFIEPIIDKAK